MSHRRASPRTDLERRILDAIATRDGLDVEQLAQVLGEDVYDVADAVQDLVERGAIRERRVAGAGADGGAARVTGRA